FVALFFVAAPYGRHIRKGWGATMDNRLAWILMEAPSPVVFLVCFLLGGRTDVISLVFLGLWLAHYLHRAFIYPFSLRGPAKRFPLAVMGLGFLFNVMNGYLNGRFVFHFSAGYALDWLSDPRFIAGIILFISGFIINRRADKVLRGLRPPGGSSYKISDDLLFRWVSSPNYLGEIIIWTGWALATWSLPGLAFAFWTAANLVPRARAHHAWYRRTFPDYPPGRKALLPGIW
ncbi:MAG: 3-oxo-5-alpha-steroid 4-dehydrogenase, partial [Chloroflexi bacterium RBG_13_57_8]